MSKSRKDRRKSKKQSAPKPRACGVFLSHATGDKAAADALAHWVKGVFHVEVFASSIDPGEKWRDKIGKAVEECRAMIILLTETSHLTQWISWEAGLAYGAGKPLFPVSVGNVDLARMPFANLQVCRWEDAKSRAALLARIANLFKKPEITSDDIGVLDAPRLKDLIGSKEKTAPLLSTPLPVHIVKDGVVAPEWSAADCDRDYPEIVDDVVKKEYRPNAVVAIVDHEQEGGLAVASHVKQQLPGRSSFIQVDVWGARGDGSDRRAEIRKEEEDKIPSDDPRLLIVDDVCFSGATIKKVRDELVRVKPGCRVFTAVLAATCDRKRGDLIPEVYARQIAGDYAVFPWGIVSRTGDLDVVPPPLMKPHRWGHSIEFSSPCRSLLTLIEPQKEMRYHFHEQRAECVVVLDHGLVAEVEDWSSRSIDPYTCIMIPRNRRHRFEAGARPVRVLEIWYGNDEPWDDRNAGR